MAGVARRLWDAARHPDGRAVLVALAVVVVVLPVWWIAGRWYQERLLDQARVDAVVETSLRANALSSVINRRLARLQGLYAFVQVELSEDDFARQFERFAAGLYGGTRGVRNLTVAPGGVVRYVYPLAGNEGVIGYDPRADPQSEVWYSTQLAIESGDVILSGPVELVQGGEGLIAQQAVYQEGAFWGLVGIVLDLPTILQEAELGKQTGDLDFALRDGPRVIYGPERVFETGPVLSPIRFPQGAWQLGAAPREGWRATVEGPLRVFQTGGLIIVGLLTGLIFLSANRQARLAQAVDERTWEIARVNEQLQRDIAERVQAEVALSEREAQYRSIFESTTDGLLIFDLEGELVDLNPAAARMHGYSAEEFRRLAPERFIHVESLALFERFIGLVREGRDFRGRAQNLRRDGTPFHVEVMGTGFTYRGRPHALAVVRDVHEEVEAFQLLEQRVEERTRELTTLLGVSANIASTLDLRPLLDLILEQLQQVVACDGASIMILEGDELRTVAHRGPISEEVLPQMHFSREQAGALWRALQGRASLVIDDVRGNIPLAQAFREALGSYFHDQMSYVHTWVGVALTVQERLIGWVGLHYSEPEAYTPHHTALAQSIAHQAAIAIENAQLYGQARRLAALEERQRLARELHDSVSQALYGIGLGIRTACTQLDRAASVTEVKRSLAEPLDYVLSLADTALTEMRSLIFELRPDSLEKEGLVAALVRQAAAVRARQDLEVHTEFCAEPELPFEVKEALYRIAQEGLYNAVRHAQANRVAIRLLEGDGSIVLEVQDDGVGFDPQREYPGHMGLHTMRERVDQLGGRLDIESSAGQGTLLRGWIPSRSTYGGAQRSGS